MTEFHHYLSVFSSLSENIPTTLYLAVMSLFWSVILGMVLTLLQTSRYKLLSLLAVLYIDIARGAPLLLLILLVFYGSKLVLNQWHINTHIVSDQTFAIVAIALSMSAYFSELMRSSYDAVSHTQREAIQSLNIPARTGFIRIIFPQAFIFSLPNLSNLLINLVKMTSLVSVIGIADVFNRAQKISQNSYGLNQIAAYVGVMLIYWILNLFIFISLKKIEKRYQYLLN